MPATGTIGRRGTWLRATPDLRAGQVIMIQRPAAVERRAAVGTQGVEVEGGELDASAFAGGR